MAPTPPPPTHPKPRHLRPTRPLNFKEAILPETTAPISSTIGAPGTTHIIRSYFSHPLPLPRLRGRHSPPKCRQSLPAAKTPSEKTQEILQALREKKFKCTYGKEGPRKISWKVEKKGKQKRGSDPVMKPIPRPSIEKVLASRKNDDSDASDPGQYMIKSCNGKTIWQFTGSTTLITTPGAKDTIPHLPLLLPSTPANPTIGPFRQLALLETNKAANRNRLIHHVLLREYRRKRAAKVEIGAKIKHRRDAGEVGECYSYWRRFRNYVPGRFGLGRSGLTNEVLASSLRGKKKRMEEKDEEREKMIVKGGVVNVEDAKVEENGKDVEAKIELLENEAEHAAKIEVLKEEEVMVESLS